MAGEVYGQIGTEGFGLGIGHTINESFGVRGEFNTFSKSYTQDSSDASYTGKVKLGGVSALGDYFPLKNGFRITAGVVFNNAKVEGSAVANSGTYTINGNSYAYGGGDSAKASIKFGDVNPYLGIGYGHNASTEGFHFTADAGVMFMNPKVSLSLSGPLASLVSQADIDAERARLQDDADKLRAYPVVKFGVTYRTNLF